MIFAYFCAPDLEDDAEVDAMSNLKISVSAWETRAERHKVRPGAVSSPVLADSYPQNIPPGHGA